MLKFCANLSTLYNEYPMMKRFEVAKNYGFRYYEMQNPYDFDPTEIRREAEGMQCVLVNSYYDQSKPFGVASIPGEEMAFCENLNKALPYHFNLGMKKIHILSGMRRNDISVDDQLQTLISNLSSMSDFLETMDITAVIEPICADVIPGYFLNSFDMAVQVITALNMDNVKMLLDIYHLHKITKDVPSNLAKYYPYAGHIQISQAPERSQPFSDNGEIDYSMVFQYLNSVKHADPIGLEYFRTEGKSTEESLEWLSQFKE